MRFGQNAVRTPGRTHDNDCVTKGVKFRAALFKGLGVAHVGRSPRPEDPKGRSPVRARIPKATPLVAPAGAKHPKTSQTKKAAQKTEKLRKGAKPSFLSFFFSK